MQVVYLRARFVRRPHRSAEITPKPMPLPIPDDF